MLETYEKETARIGDRLIIELTTGTLGRYTVEKIYPAGSFGKLESDGLVVLASDDSSEDAEDAFTDLQWRYVKNVWLVERGPKPLTRNEKIKRETDALVRAAMAWADVKGSTHDFVAADIATRKASLNKLKKARSALYDLVLKNDA